MALTPWPTTEPELTAAVQSLAAAAFGDSAKDRIKAQRLGPVGSDLVEKYSPHAPQDVRDEAVILVSAWIGHQTSGLTPGLEIKAGGITLSRRRYRGEISALRHSGAMALLSPWKIRRAGKLTLDPGPATMAPATRRPNYYLGSIAGDVLTGREFFEIGIPFDADYIVLHGGGSRQMNFALTISSVSVIRAPNGRNIIHQFNSTPLQLTISDSQYFVFSSNSQRDQTAGTWLVQG